ncbi:MAG: hypothetical protein IH991_22015 [Planctomycetes bacterium]|nr:hypothetical protein [Planctomycetota bacterium]
MTDSMAKVSQARADLATGVLADLEQDDIPPEVMEKLIKAFERHRLKDT